MIWWYIYVVEYCCTKYHVDVKILSNFVSDLKSAFISDLKSAKKKQVMLKCCPFFGWKQGQNHTSTWILRAKSQGKSCLLYSKLTPSSLFHRMGATCFFGLKNWGQICTTQKTRANSPIAPETGARTPKPQINKPSIKFLVVNPCPLCSHGLYPKGNLKLWLI